MLRKGYSSKTIFSIGFFSIISLLMLVMALWVSDLNLHNEHLGHIVDEERNRELVSNMRDVAYQRAVTLHRMADSKDPFVRDEEYMYFGELARNFIKAKDGLLEHLNENTIEMQLWEDARTAILNGETIQKEVAELILEDRVEEAREILINDLAPNQKIVIEKLKILYDEMGEDITDDILDAEESSNSTFILVSFLGSATILFLVFTIYVIRRTGKTETALVEQGERIYSLYEVTAMTGVTEEDRLDKMLEIGCRFLGMDLAMLCKVDLAAGQCELLNVCGEDRHQEFHPGSKLELNKTMASVVFASDKTLAVKHIGESDLNQLECYRETGIEACIATPIFVYKKKFGTVSFSRRTPKETGFSDTDKDLVSLIGSWISVTLEHKYAHEEAVDAKLTAEDANNAKSVFLAKMSHELRTPLNAIIGYSDLLLEEITDADLVDDLKRINSAGNNLLGLINDVLDISKIEVGKMDFHIEDVEIAGIVDMVSAVAQPLMDKNNNQFHLHVSPTSRIDMVKADRLKLKQVLLNLLGNASKFTQGGDISLNISNIHEGGQDWVIFSVVDTGIGISAEQQENIFNAFTQIETRGTNNSDGTGLGLAISRQLCRMMGGDITVTSTPGSGSVFSIALPASDGKQSKDKGDQDASPDNLLEFRKGANAS